MERIRAAGASSSYPRVYQPAYARGRPTRFARRPQVILAVAVGIAALIVVTSIAGHTATQTPMFPIENLDGTGNNQGRPNLGAAGAPLQRIGDANYVDGVGAPAAGPNPRFVSNRIFNDINQNLFSQHNLSGFVDAWGQFIGMDISLTDVGRERMDIPFTAHDPLESFTDNDGVIPFTRSSMAAGTGVTTPRQQINDQTSFLDMSQLYGTSNARMQFMRAGTNGALLFLPGGQLPRRDAKGNAAAAPTVQVAGRLLATPNRAVGAGDPRVNQMVAVQALVTLFAREHNRIVAQLPNTLSNEQKFQVARRVVIAEEQYITYNEFLPTLGVTLPNYQGYNPNVNPDAFNEFATFGFSVDSMVHGALDVTADANRYSAQQVTQFKNEGIQVQPVTTAGRKQLALQVPLNLAEYNPGLLTQIQLGPLLQGLDAPQNLNDELVDNQMRSILYQVPARATANCLFDGPQLPKCFKNVTDDAALTVQRSRDNGLPTYNALRQALGLAPKQSFAAITGEATEAFPANAGLILGNEVNDANSLGFVSLRDAVGNALPVGSAQAQQAAVSGVRRTTTADRLKAVYGTVANVDAFTGMIAEQRVAGTEMGELELALMQKQFTALRDGDRFFFENDQGLGAIQQNYGITFAHPLADVIAANTDIRRTDLNNNVFLATGNVFSPGTGPVVANPNGIQAPGAVPVPTAVNPPVPGAGVPGTGTGGVGPITLGLALVPIRSLRRRRRRTRGSDHTHHTADPAPNEGEQG